MSKNSTFFFASLIAFLLLMGGCAAQPKSLRPSVWPAMFSGRQYQAEHNLVIYARNHREAKDIADHITDVAREFTHNTGAQVMNGLVIINDLGDSQIGHVDLEKMMPDEKREPELIEMGFTMQEFVMAMGLPIGREQLALDFTPAALQTVHWVASVPSQKRVDKFTDHLIDAGLKKQNLNLFQRMLIMPFMPLIHGLISDALNAERDTAIYGCFCSSQSSWNEDRRQKEAQDYAQKRMGAVVKSLKATTRQIGHGE